MKKEGFTEKIYNSRNFNMPLAIEWRFDGTSIYNSRNFNMPLAKKCFKVKNKSTTVEILICL